MGKIKPPKRIFGFMLSKGTRKDLAKRLRMVEHPDKRALAITVGTGLATFLAERFTERQLEHVQDRRRSTSSPGPMDALAAAALSEATRSPERLASPALL